MLELLAGKYREPAECVIRVAGAEIADLYPYLSEVSVDASHDKPAVANLIFDSRRDERGKWNVQDDGRLAPWETIVIEAAFGSTTEEVMRGFIRQVQADYPEDAGRASITVECRDSSLVLDREHIRKAWGADVPATDMMIVTAIIAKYGLAPDSNNAMGQTGLVVNQDGTDIEFLRRRARAKATTCASAKAKSISVRCALTQPGSPPSWFTPAKIPKVCASPSATMGTSPTRSRLTGPTRRAAAISIRR